MLRFKFCLFLSLLFLSCQSPDGEPSIDPGFFNIEEYLAAEISILDSNKPNVTKTATLNDKVEVIELDGSEIDWKEELEQFNVLQIDKAALWDKYEIDTISIESGKEIKYIAKDRRLRVDELILIVRNGKVVKFSAKSSVKNFLQSTSRQWSYQQGGEVYIQGESKILFMEPQSYSAKIAASN